jgi:hypothetical protein
LDKLAKGKIWRGADPARQGNLCSPVEIALCDDRVDVTMNISTQQMVDEISRLPARKLIYIRARVDGALMSLRPRLRRAGFTDMGLEPAAGGEWFWLLQRGYHPRQLDLSCPIAIALQKTANGDINHNARA